jgi:hypothetical protein
VLGFMPGLVLALAALFPNSNTGLELAAILMIFTGPGVEHDLQLLLLAAGHPGRADRGEQRSEVVRFWEDKDSGGTRPSAPTERNIAGRHIAAVGNAALDDAERGRRVGQRARRGT